MHTWGYRRRPNLSNPSTEYRFSAAMRIGDPLRYSLLPPGFPHSHIRGDRSGGMNVAILLYDGFDELDAIGPYEVFQSAGESDAEMSAELVTLEPVERIEASHGLRIEPDGVLGDTSADVLLVPGGGWSDHDSPGVRTEFEDGAIPDAVAAAHAEGTTVASVCTGAMLLSKAGLLDGRPATTHHTALADLRETEADVREVRYVDDGDVLTAAGITSGIDLALHIVERACGTDVASGVARNLEYERAI
jgi:transcriptional regulator GlxA family with amidase domain